jgi:hypothetical protein
MFWTPNLSPQDSALAYRTMDRLRSSLEEQGLQITLTEGLEALQAISDHRKIWPQYDFKLHPGKPSEQSIVCIVRDAEKRPVAAAAGIYYPLGTTSLDQMMTTGKLWYEADGEMERRGERCYVSSPILRMSEPCGFLSALWTAQKISTPLVSMATVAVCRLINLYILTRWNCDVVAVASDAVTRAYASTVAGFLIIGRGCWVPYTDIGDTLKERHRWVLWMPREPGLGQYLRPEAGNPYHRFLVEPA